MSKTEKLYKNACSLNLAVLLRAVRFGPRDAVRRAVRAYHLINPLAREKGREPWDDPRRIRGSGASWPCSPGLTSRRRSRPIGPSSSTACSPRRWITRIRTRSALMSLLRDREPDVVLEIGTYNGATTRLIALNLPRAKIHTLDLPPDISSEELHQSKLPKDEFHLIGNRRVGEAIVRTGNHQRHTALRRFRDRGLLAVADRFRLHRRLPHLSVYPKRHDPLCRSGRRAGHLVWHDFDCATTTSSAISPKWRVLVCRCVTSHRPTWP